MSTRLIENRQHGANLKTLTNQQRAFVGELLAEETFCPTKAARAAGYKCARQAAYKLLNKREIKAALGKAQREREERCELKGDDVLDYLRTALFLNPLHHFSPSEDGGWLLTDPNTLPEEIGRLIESMEVKVVESDDGERTSTFKVSFVSKTTVLNLAMKHLGLLPDRVKATIEQATTVQLDWDKLCEPPAELDAIEQRIAGVKCA